MSNIYVDDIGNGFPFVFVHGYLGSSEMWCFQKNYFSKYCRVIAPAIPGFGESHNVHLEQPDKFNILIKNFLD